MTDRPIEVQQALEQLAERCDQLRDLAHADELARMIDDLNARLLERFTVPPKANSALGAFGGERCR